jgi:hypothetical protein
MTPLSVSLPRPEALDYLPTAWSNYALRKLFVRAGGTWGYRR